MREDWQTPLGALLTREERMKLYGGARYGGIEPPRTTPTDDLIDYLQSVQVSCVYEEPDSGFIRIQARS
jgi:hypothetical protein